MADPVGHRVILNPACRHGHRRSREWASCRRREKN